MDILRTFIVGGLTALVLCGFAVIFKRMGAGITVAVHLLSSLPEQSTKRRFVYLGKEFDADRFVEMNKRGLPTKGSMQRYKLENECTKKLAKRPNHPLYQLRLEAIQMPDEAMDSQSPPTNDTQIAPARRHIAISLGFGLFSIATLFSDHRGFLLIGLFAGVVAIFQAHTAKKKTY